MLARLALAIKIAAAISLADLALAAAGSVALKVPYLGALELLLLLEAALLFVAGGLEGSYLRALLAEREEVKAGELAKKSAARSLTMVLLAALLLTEAFLLSLLPA